MSCKRASRGLDKKLRDYVYELHKGICQNCGLWTDFEDYRVIGGVDGHRVLGPTYPTLEHIIPRCLGGQSVRENVTLFCRECNWNGGKALEERLAS